jgi:hypothetical protein
VYHQLRHNAHPTNLSATVNRRFDLHLTQTNVFPRMNPPKTMRALHPTLPPLSATTVVASASTPLCDPHRTTVPPTNNHPTMKIPLLKINKVLTL